MMWGRIDEVDGHYVATKFFAFAIPVACMYVAHEDPRSTKPGFDGGVKVRMDARSIALAYARVWMPILAIAVPVLFVLRGSVPIAIWPMSAILLGSSRRCAK
jgi:hypothetical protein